MENIPGVTLKWLSSSVLPFDLSSMLFFLFPLNLNVYKSVVEQG